MLKKDDDREQMVYYQAGIGTYSDNPLLALPLISQISNTLDRMVAWSLGRHVRDGYAFLMQNYNAGDKICIFGFSRGAYTARALAGMLHKVGLLSSCNYQQLPFAYKMYKRDDEYGWRMSAIFKKTFSIHVNVDFVGVWDTVASVGVIPRYLPLSSSNDAIRIFRHAVSLDERRVRFIPSFYDTSSTSPWNRLMAFLECSIESLVQPTTPQSVPEAQELTDCKEVFFAGTHCDVGGGSVKNHTRHSLARIPLRWMIRECFRTDTGILFDASLREVLGLDIDRLRAGDMSEPERISPGSQDSLPTRPCAMTTPCSALTVWDTISYVMSCVSFLVFSLYAWIFCRPAPRINEGASVLLAREPCIHGTKQRLFEGEAVEELHDALSPMYDQMNAMLLWRLMEWVPQKVKLDLNVADGKDDYVWM
ncbi:hypothetical protein PUNSTDRAFT_130247 [Punctularia strigosozonata HHB-11173 SS5]|uniref:uncharacterized protein n=1 Tax=Punctularia strigosozonata (strain HHB-11173) TaxID=741275 RepID=UPI0004417BD2|nr:uncharacterized protein PUNSTDRAFT_130247 [Punctularia strigosozonata HHB-11173 SS5]EIN14621.1 hypothetical protein PUNSTDRAFT_130247 [Punctularia strigosozonata HHB-11173 SS5]